MRYASPAPSPQGGIIDDSVITKVKPGELYLVVNAVWILCAVMRPAPDADSILGSDEHDE